VGPEAAPDRPLDGDLDQFLDTDWWRGFSTGDRLQRR
jgi:hypothetical protein